MRPALVTTALLTAPLLLACEATPDPTDDTGPKISVFGPDRNNVVWLSADPEAEVSARGCPDGTTLRPNYLWWEAAAQPIRYIHPPNGGTAEFGVSVADPSGIAKVRIVMPLGVTVRPTENVTEQDLPLAHGNTGTFIVYEETMTAPRTPNLVSIKHTPQYTLGNVSRSYNIEATDMVGNRSVFSAIIADEADFCF